MARELGLNPKKLGSLANHKQEPWKSPLPDFIEYLYAKRFGRERPEVVTPIGQTPRPAPGEQRGTSSKPVRGGADDGPS
jgi:hypothetical protein